MESNPPLPKDVPQWPQPTRAPGERSYEIPTVDNQYNSTVGCKPKLDRTSSNFAGATKSSNVHQFQFRSESPEVQQEEEVEEIEGKDPKQDPTLHFEQAHIPRIGLLRNVNRTLPTMPEEDRVFEAYKVEYIMKDILESKLKRTFYEPTSCSRLSKELCALIKDKTKELEYDRYKIVCQVMIGQDTNQSVQIATRCLWNHETDNFAAATFRNSYIYAVAVVYGLLLE